MNELEIARLLLTMNAEQLAEMQRIMKEAENRDR